MRIDEALSQARMFGLNAVTPFLPPRNDPRFASELLSLFRADVGSLSADAALAKLGEYRNAFPEWTADLSASMPANELSRSIHRNPTPLPVRARPRLLGVNAATPTTSLQTAGVRDDDPALPRVGDTVFGFRINSVLGRGGFGVVYKGEQLDLGGREVALKFTLRPSREPEVLAALQHTHIVPVYSVHSRPPMQVLCMPYLGETTLANILELVLDRSKPAPHSGAGLVSTKKLVKDTTREEMIPAVVPQAKRKEHISHQTLDALAAKSYPDAVLWMIARLAEALAHTHARGIIHLDLKPGNVLITDEGVPMVLDFGLAHDERQGKYERIGGTMRYMAPEQLQQFAAGRVIPDPRMDLYALGVMMYELLARRHPFEESIASPKTLTEVIAARRGPPTSVRQFNPEVSAAVDAIVLKLLDPRPAHRYATADDFLADALCQEEHLPLKHAANTSVWELAVKFRRRRPVLLAGIAAGLFALTTVVASGTVLRQSHEQAVAKAAAAARQVTDDLHALRMDLTARDKPELRARGIQAVDKTFAHYKVSDADWTTGEEVARLSEKDRATLRATLGELALLAAHAERMNATDATAAERAIAWNEKAEWCFPREAIPTAVNEQRALLGKDLPLIDDARLAKEGAVDFYLCGLNHLLADDAASAARSLNALVELEPQHAAGQYALARVEESQSQPEAALVRYQLVATMAKADARPAYRRGRLLSLDRKYAAAAGAFTTAIDRDPKNHMYLYERALAYRELGRLDEALTDADAALLAGEPAFRTRSLLLDLHTKLGHADAAAAEQAALAKLEPTDAADYVARGQLRRDTDPQAALADFDRAANLCPTYIHAWQNQSKVLLELDRPRDAVKALDQILSFAANYTPAKASKMVLLARLGDRDPAVKLAEELATNSPDESLHYKLAWTYAITAATYADDTKAAVKHLRLALKKGFVAFDKLEEDDFRTIRDLPEVKAAIKAAKELQQ